MLSEINLFSVIFQFKNLASYLEGVKGVRLLVIGTKFLYSYWLLVRRLNVRD